MRLSDNESERVAYATGAQVSAQLSAAVQFADAFGRMIERVICHDAQIIVWHFDSLAT
jgi:hypothetical protein